MFFINKIIKFLKVKTCSHLFKASDMKPRDEKGLIKWQCCKCSKVFVDNCGLDILNYGKCDGKWGDYNKHFNHLNPNP